MCKITSRRLRGQRTIRVPAGLLEKQVFCQEVAEKCFCWGLRYQYSGIAYSCFVSQNGRRTNPAILHIVCWTQTQSAALSPESCWCSTAQSQARLPQHRNKHPFHRHFQGKLTAFLGSSSAVQNMHSFTVSSLPLLSKEFYLPARVPTNTVWEVSLRGICN